MPYRLVLLFLLVIAAAGAQEGVPVVVDNRPLWTVKAARAGLAPAERAQDVQASIVHVAEDSRRSLGDLREAHLDSESILLLSRAYIFSVTDEDAKLEGRTRQELFAERKQIVLAAVARYRKEREVTSLLRSIGLAVGALFLALILLVSLHWAYKKIVPVLVRAMTPRSQASRVASLYRIFEAPLIFLVRLCLRLGFWAVGLTILFSLLSFALGLFPMTAGVSSAVAGQAWQMVGAVGANLLSYLPKLLVLLIVAAMTYGLIGAARSLSQGIASGALVIPGFHQEWTAPTYDLVKFLLVLFGLVVAFPYLPGGESEALKGASIFVGVLVSLGSGSAMGNVVAGVILTYMRPFRVGDRVKIADTTGDVMEKSLLVTRVRTIKNVEVILPNSAVLGAHILNYSAHARERGLILHTTVTLGYDAPWRRVHELLIAAALRTDFIRSEPKPFVLQPSLNDSHISYELNAYTDEANRMAELYSELHKNIQEAFNGSGVEIMSPMYLSVRDGNTVTIPEAHRPADYKAPAFRIHEEHQ